MHKPHIILASSSSYRKALLQKLHLSFTCASPDIDETIHSNESAENAVKRLAVSKALAVAKKPGYQNTIIISSDQVACLNNRILGKPGNREDAIAQLSLSSGNKVSFLTSLCVYNTRDHSHQLHVETFSVYFRQLNREEIENYIDADQPFDCAGSFKAEKLGIALFEKMEGNDPNSLIGLPLIQLVSLLKNVGVNVLGKNSGITAPNTP